MPTLRDCCRHPRASSPDLPNVQIVPSPTQDEGYDADAVRISTPIEIFVESVRPSPDEPRPSSDTIVRHSPLQTPNDDENGSQTRSKSLRVQRVNSIHIPRRRSHTQSQLLSSPSSAAPEHYTKLSPSRTALRKRLEAVKIIDSSETPLSPNVDPARITGISESSIPSRRPVLRDVDTNEHDGEVIGRENSKSALKKPKPETISSQKNSEMDNAPLNAMPGSYQSNSTEVSIHLYNMQISERVASSNSNIVALSGLRERRNRSSTTGSHPIQSRGSSGYHCRRESSSLQSPKESSSVYTSNEDELALSRRSSMLMIQGMPERIQRLKNHATIGDLYSISAQHSQITVIPRSRFPTTCTEASTNAETGKAKAEHGEQDLYEGRSRSPPLRRSSTEPRLNRFKRGAPASFDGSGEWHLSPPTRQPTRLLPRQSTGLLVRQPTGLLSPEDPASVWEKALREHAQEDKAISQARVGSISYEIGRDDFKRRVMSRRFTRTPSPLQGITEDPWSQRRRLESGPASGRVSPTQVMSGRNPPIPQKSPAPKISDHAFARQASSSTRSVDSWTRYPSYNFAERTEIANAKDRVVTRDFAICNANTSGPSALDAVAEGQPGRSPWRTVSKRKSRSMTFGRRFLHKVGRLYKTRSSDFRRYNAGHRSSIFEGGVLQYPELEIPRPTVEPVLLSGPRASDTHSMAAPEDVLQEAVQIPIPPTPQPLCMDEPQPELGMPSPQLNVVEWQKTYDDCILYPRNTSTDEEIAPDEVGPTNVSDLKLDEAQQAEVDKAKDEALKAADDCLRRSMEMVRYPKRLNCP